jgi:hypothetical protein
LHLAFSIGISLMFLIHILCHREIKSYRNGDVIFILVFVFRSIVALNSALPCRKVLTFVFLVAVLRTYHRLVFVPLINMLLLGATVLPTVLRWLKIIFLLSSSLLRCYKLPCFVLCVCFFLSFTRAPF